MQKIHPCLWFDRNAEEAVNFYASVFKGSKIGNTVRYGAAGAKASGLPEGTIMTIAFELEGEQFLALNGGPHFKFTPAISIVVNCESQAEVDELWEKLCEGGKPDQCGWLYDQFGVSWQIVPTAMEEMLQDPDREKSERVMRALLKMKKLDLDALRRAYEGKAD